MSKTTEKISILQAAMLLVTDVGISVHVEIIPTLLQAAGRDAWISILAATLPFMMWILLLFFIMKRTQQQNLFTWLKKRWGTIIAWLFILPILFELFLVASVTMRDVSYWTNISYLPKTPNLVLVTFFSLVSFFSVYSGIRSMAITNGILLPFVLLFGFFVASSNMPNKDYTLMFPMFEHGYKPALLGMIYAGSGFVGLMSILFMQHHIRAKIGLLPLFITGLFLVWLTLGPVTGAIAEFGPFEAGRQRFTSFEEWRLVTFGHFLEHVDFLSIYQWLVGAFTRISLSIFLISDLLDMKKSTKRVWFLILLYSALIMVTQAPISDMKYVELIANIFLPFTLAFFVFLSFTLAFAVWFKTRGKMNS